MRSNAKITCDADGCTKQLGEKNDHVAIVANHVLPTAETDGVPTSATSGDFDFCSWDHAAAFFKAHAADAAESRAAKLADLTAAEEAAAESDEPPAEPPA